MPQGEVGVDEEVEVLCDRPLEGGAHAAQQELVRDQVAFIGKSEAAVHLHAGP